MNYRKGYILEQKVRKELEAKGFYVVRSAGSHGAADLVGLCSDGLILVQVGTYGSKGKEDYEKLRKVPAPSGTIREVWLWVSRVGWKIDRLD